MVSEPGGDQARPEQVGFFAGTGEFYGADTPPVSGPCGRRGPAAQRGQRLPKGGFGQYPSDDEVGLWEDDDQATIATLTEAAFATESPVIRRLIRQAVEWTADYATSLPLQHTARRRPGAPV